MHVQFILGKRKGNTFSFKRASDTGLLGRAATAGGGVVSGIVLYLLLAYHLIILHRPQLTYHGGSACVLEAQIVLEMSFAINHARLSEEVG